MIINTFHFLRPWSFLLLLPVGFLLFLLWRQKPQFKSWAAICDPHLLAHLIPNNEQKTYKKSLLGLFASLLFLILSLSGPTWQQLPVMTYKAVQPHVFLLDMSKNMLEKDLSPNRLNRAKFKLRDLFSIKNAGQFGLIAYTAEPFIVSPITDDAHTISALLPALTPDIMPLSGHNLEAALKEAQKLIQQAGYHQGQILVLSANKPSDDAIAFAKQLAQKRVYTSIMPMEASQPLNPLFQTFADESGGQLLPYTSDSKQLEQWLQARSHSQFNRNQEEGMPLWRDEGHWFLIPALMFFLPVFRRGWLERITV